LGSAGGGGGAFGSAGGGGGPCIVLSAGGGGGGGVVGSAYATGSDSATAVAPVSAAIASVIERPLRWSGVASGCCMWKKLPCYRRDASVSCS
jgi:hypothetical protein